MLFVTTKTSGNKWKDTEVTTNCPRCKQYTCIGSNMRSIILLWIINISVFVVVVFRYNIKIIFSLLTLRVHVLELLRCHSWGGGGVVAMSQLGRRWSCCGVTVGEEVELLRCHSWGGGGVVAVSQLGRR